MNMLARLFHRDAADVRERREPVALRPVPRTWNRENASFDAVLASATPIERQGFDEVLSIDPGSVKLPASLPVLDTHNRQSLDARLGTIDSLRLEGGQLIGRVVLSKHNERAKRIAAEIDDGHLPALSVGYRVTKWTERQNGGRRERVAVHWEPLEASLVACPADPNATMREETDMTTRTTHAPGSRSAEIRTIARTAGLDATWADGLIDRQANVEEARAAAFEAMRERTEPASRIQTVTRTRELDDPQERIRAMGEAIYMRSNPAHRPSDRARQYAGLSLVEMARECLRANGINTTALSASTVIERATSPMIGLHSTSDFALALSDNVGRVLVASYRASPSPLLQIVRKVEVRDFKPRQTVRMTAALGLERVNEAGEFKGGTISEAGESYSVRTFGKIIGLTRQAMVNDDLNALSTIPAMMGTGAASFVAQFVATLLSANPVMSDGRTVFHADHGNVGTPSATLDVDALSEARLLMRSQRDDAGEIVGVRPAYLIVSPTRETEAEGILATIAAATVGDVNPFSGGLQLIVESRLAGDAFYLAADPNVMPSIELATLAGEAEPQVIIENGFDIDGARWRVRLDLGGAVIDHRGLVMNDGTP